MNNIKAFEAAAEYDLFSLKMATGNDYKGYMVLFDTDTVSAAVCRCNEKEVEQLWETTEKAGDFFGELSKSVLGSGADNIELCRELYGFLREWDNVIRSYIRVPDVDDILPMPPSIKDTVQSTITCKELSDIFEKELKTQLEKVTKAAKKQLETYDAQSPKIVVMGKTAAVYLVSHCIKKAFYPMPLLQILPDFSLYSLFEGNGEIIKNGMKCARGRGNSGTLEHSFSLRLYKRGSENSEEITILAQKGTEYSQLGNAQYSKMFAAFPDDEITLFIDSEIHRFALPQELFEKDSGYIRLKVAIGIRESDPVLLIEAENGTHSYINLPSRRNENNEYKNGIGATESSF